MRKTSLSANGYDTGEASRSCVIGSVATTSEEVSAGTILAPPLTNGGFDMDFSYWRSSGLESFFTQANRNPTRKGGVRESIPLKKEVNTCKHATRRSKCLDTSLF